MNDNLVFGDKRLRGLNELIQSIEMSGVKVNVGCLSSWLFEFSSCKTGDSIFAYLQSRLEVILKAKSSGVGIISNCFLLRSLFQLIHFASVYRIVQVPQAEQFRMQGFKPTSL
jgi:hypothetical protein